MDKLISVFMLWIVGSMALAQTHPKTAHIRSVTLDTVLSCANDDLLEEVFKTDVLTARLKLNSLGMIMSKKHRQDDPALQALLAKGFFTDTVDDSVVRVVPTDYLGKIVDEAKLTFCHYGPLAHYEYSADSSWFDKNNRPRLIEIEGDDWYLNPNEVFAHADQFHFESGTFSNSSRVFFTATKGSVSIQFVCRPDGLKLYRVFYSPRD